MLTITLPIFSRPFVAPFLGDLEHRTETMKRNDGSRRERLVITCTIEQAQAILDGTTKVELSEEDRREFVSMGSARRLLFQTRELIETEIKKRKADRAIPCWRCKALGFPHTVCGCGADILPPFED